MNEAAEIKLDAERKAGAALSAMDPNKGTRGQLAGGNTTLPPDDKPTLADLGITKRQSANWKAEASVSEPEYRRWVQEKKADGKPLTSQGLVKEARKSPPPSPAARSGRNPCTPGVTAGSAAL
jgi:hypothetical protein